MSAAFACKALGNSIKQTVVILCSSKKWSWLKLTWPTRLTLLRTVLEYRPLVLPFRFFECVVAMARFPYRCWWGPYWKFVRCSARSPLASHFVIHGFFLADWPCKIVKTNWTWTYRFATVERSLDFRKNSRILSRTCKTTCLGLDFMLIKKCVPISAVFKGFWGFTKNH